MPSPGHHSETISGPPLSVLYALGPTSTRYVAGFLCRLGLLMPRISARLACGLARPPAFATPGWIPGPTPRRRLRLLGRVGLRTSIERHERPLGNSGRPRRILRFVMPHAVTSARGELGALESPSPAQRGARRSGSRRARPLAATPGHGSPQRVRRTLREQELVPVIHLGRSISGPRACVADENTRGRETLVQDWR